VVIPPIPPSPPSPPAAPAAGASSAGASSAGAASGSDGFSNSILNAVDQLQGAQTNASSQAAQVATGQGNIGDAMIAATQASVDTQVTQAMVTKALDAFNSIMGMSF
jgi:flagellar hook-basal body complex protein FliE